MTVKNKKMFDKPQKQESKADWTKKIALKDGEVVTIRLLRPLNELYQESDGKYAEVKHEYRDAWYPMGDKPAELKGRALSMPILDFSTPKSDHLSPMNYLADHPGLLKTPSGKDLKISNIKTQIDIVVQASPVYRQDDKSAYADGGAAYSFSPETKIYSPSVKVYRELVSAYQIYEAENGTPPLGVPIQIKRTGSTMNNTSYSINIRENKVDKSFDPYAVEIDVDLMDYIYFQEWEQQMAHLAKLGIHLPISNPDGDDEDFSAPDYGDEEDEE